MKAVMISIQPKWCELIMSGKKTVEVRKTKPKLETPFKCYIYCTKDNTDVVPSRIWWKADKTGFQHIMNGKVIGEFICDDIRWGNPVKFVVKEDAERTLKGSCLTIEDMYNYLNVKDGTSRYEKKYEFYCWHISDLKIYDKPKKLSDFRHTTEYIYNSLKGVAFWESGIDDECAAQIHRPPQSWCYVEELG